MEEGAGGAVEGFAIDLGLAVVFAVCALVEVVVLFDKAVGGGVLSGGAELGEEIVALAPGAELDGLVGIVAETEIDEVVVD